MLSLGKKAVDELVELRRLAIPLAATNLGDMALALVDVAIVGRLGEAELAGASLGNTLFFVLTMLGMGLILGVDPLIAQALGAGEPRRARALMWQSLWLALTAGVVLSGAAIAVAMIAPSLVANPRTGELLRAYMFARAPSLLPLLALIALRRYLQAIGQGRILFISVLVANIANAPIALMLAFGAFGLPGLGVVGAGVATTVAVLVELALAAAPMAWLPVPGGGWRARSIRALDPAGLARIVRIGTPIAAQLVAEVGSFTLVTLAITALGDDSILGGHQIALTLVSVTFQVALGIAAATGVRVGHAIGRSDRDGTRRAGLIGIVAGALFMLGGAITLVAIPGPLAALLTDQPAVIAAAVPLIVIAGCFQLSDGVQTVAQGALRGAGDTVWPLGINLAGHYLVGLPIGFALAELAGWGAKGWWWGLSAALTAVAIAMTVRLLLLSRRPIARRELTEPSATEAAAAI